MALHSTRATSAPEDVLDRLRIEARAASVLVVDDEDETREMLQLLLERAGYLVMTASNGREALEVLDTARPDLILLDLQMPVMDGYEFRQAQRRDSRLISIPTIVLTGTSYEPMLDPAIAETLRKPVRRDRLLALVGRYMNIQ